MSAPSLSEDDPPALARYLLSFRWPGRNAEVHRKLVDGGLALWRHILALVPRPVTRGRALEAGSPPFNITLVERFRDYDLSLTAFVADGRAEFVHEVESPEFGERHRFVCRCFDVERDRFPYPDAAFDLVLWCEVIEHLTENPVHALAEIRRVLRPGGTLVISTPNVTWADNIARLLDGKNIYEPYHLGAPLRGSRHSHEYTLEELAYLVAECGFTVDHLEDADVDAARTARKQLFRLLLTRVVARLNGRRYHSHLFVRARRTDAPFRWVFPELLFDQGHIAFLHAPRDAAVEMGRNEQLHVTLGWGEIEAWHGAGDTLRLLGRSAFAGEAGVWREVTVPLTGRHEPGAVVHVRFAAPGVDVHAVRLE
jgi:SAM-dependent methyltransferase